MKLEVGANVIKNQIAPIITQTFLHLRTANKIASIISPEINYGGICHRRTEREATVHIKIEGKVKQLQVIKNNNL